MCYETLIIKPAFIIARDVGDDSGGAIERDYVIILRPGVLLAEALEELNHREPATRCQHEYDCCGNYYGGGWRERAARKVPYESGTYIITRRWTQNV